MDSNIFDNVLYVQFRIKIKHKTYANVFRITSNCVLTIWN